MGAGTRLFAEINSAASVVYIEHAILNLKILAYDSKSMTQKSLKVDF